MNRRPEEIRLTPQYQLALELLKNEPTPVTGGQSVADAGIRGCAFAWTAALLVARRDVVLGRYPTELRTHNGRRARHDLIQELVDAYMYSTQIDLEAGLDPLFPSLRTTRIEQLIKNELVEMGLWAS